MIRGSDARDVDRLLQRLEAVFRVAFAILAALLVVGQAALLTGEERSRLTRVDRLEGVELGTSNSRTSQVR